MGAIRAALLDAVVAALPVALVYFAGWAYLSSYLDAFGIDYTQVSIPLTTVLVYAFTPLSNWRVLSMAAVILIVWQCVALTPSCRKLQVRTSITACAVILAAMMFTIKAVAASEAKEMAEYVWRGEKSISNFILTRLDAQESGYQKFVDCRIKDQLRQILGLPEQTFLLCINKRWKDNAVLFVIKADGTISYYAARRKSHVE